MNPETKTDRQERIKNFCQEAIRNTKVAVIGAGATGNEVLKCLALTGFRYTLITDMDFISTSNLSRTVLFSEADVGKQKAETAAERFRNMNICADPAADFLDGDICHALGEGALRHCDIVIGCVDNEQTRLYISNICQLLEKPYIDTGIEGFNWNVLPTSGKTDCACLACTMSSRGEKRALMRVRNSCDVTRRKASEEGHVPTIGIAASAAAALAVGEAIKISHWLHDPNSGMISPRFGYYSLFTADENRLTNILLPVRSDCEHHDTYRNHGGITETPLSAHRKLKDVLSWAENTYGKKYAISLCKDTVCADRSFITTGFCVHCGKEISVFRPQPVFEGDLLCDECKRDNLPALRLSGAVEKVIFSEDDLDLLDKSLLELGIPLLHIVEFFPKDGDGDSLFLELTGDLHEVMPSL